MGIDSLENLPVGESAQFSDIETRKPSQPKQIPLEVDPANYVALSIHNRGGMKRSHEVADNNNERLSYLHNSLQAFTELHCSHCSMESLLQTASRLVVNTLDLEHCSIGWLDEEELGIRVWTSHTREGANVNSSRVHRVFSCLVNKQRSRSGNSATLACQPEPDLELSQRVEIMSPLRINKQIVGYVCGLKNEFTNTSILNSERLLFATLSQHISAAIEAQRTREMLDCPYIALALSAKERESFAGLTSVQRPFLDPINNPEQLVRKIARRFFKDLRRAGFETKQIMSVSTEILDNLLVVLHNTKSRRKKSPPSKLPMKQ